MKRFLVSKDVGFNNDVNIGIAPGKFDTKQLILSALAVLIHSSDEKFVYFVRTIERTVLAKCNLFINDDFTTMFPVIPSYYDIETTWKKNCKTILRNYSNFDDESIKFIEGSVREKICNLESIDCIMELYEASSSSYNDSFEEALNVTLKLIEKFIKDSLKERMYYLTVKNYVQKADKNYITPPIYVQGWRSIVQNVNCSNQIEYAIFSEDDSYIIEAFDKDLIFKKYVKGMQGVYYSGRFFVKVADMEAALKIIDKLPTFAMQDNEKLA